MDNMDLSNLQTSSNENDLVASSDIAAEIPSKPITQKKTFPTNVLKWLKKNATPQMALKLMQVCKYFRHKTFPYFVVKNITAYDDSIYYTTLNGVSHEWETIKEIPENLWITNIISTDLLPQTYFISQLIPKIAVCGAEKLILEDEEIFMGEFKVLTASKTVIELHLKRTMIYDDEGEPVPLEDILECIPAIEDIYFVTHIPSFSTFDAAKELVLPNLKTLHLHFIQSDFYILPFIQFMKKHKTVKFTLFYHPFSSCSNAQLLQNYINEIADNDEYVQADITFPNFAF